MGNEHHSSEYAHSVFYSLYLIHYSLIFLTQKLEATAKKPTAFLQSV